MEVFSFLLLYLFPPVGKGVADGLLHCKRPPFAVRKVAFHADAPYGLPRRGAVSAFHVVGGQLFIHGRRHAVYFLEGAVEAYRVGVSYFLVNRLDCHVPVVLFVGSGKATRL